MSIYHYRNAFSLFEAVVCVVILGVIGIICSSMLLQVSKNIAYTKALSDSSPHLALLKIQNLLQYAIAESISTNGTPLNAPASTISFYSIQEALLFGGGTKDTIQEIKNDTLFPAISPIIDSHHDNALHFKTIKGWQNTQEIYLIGVSKEPFQPYKITNIKGNTLYIDKKPIHAPHLAIPIQSHTIALHNNALWLDNSLLIDDVLSFLITPVSFAQGTFFELQLCVKSPTKARCENETIWLDEIVRTLR